MIAVHGVLHELTFFTKKFAAYILRKSNSHGRKVKLQNNGRSRRNHSIYSMVQQELSFSLCFNIVLDWNERSLLLSIRSWSFPSRSMRLFMVWWRIAFVSSISVFSPVSLSTVFGSWYILRIFSNPGTLKTLSLVLFVHSSALTVFENSSIATLRSEYAALFGYSSSVSTAHAKQSGRTRT